MDCLFIIKLIIYKISINIKLVKNIIHYLILIMNHAIFFQKTSYLFQVKYAYLGFSQLKNAKSIFINGNTEIQR